MEQRHIPPETSIDVEALTRTLLARKTTRVRFRLPATPSQAVSLLTAAYRAEVEFRNRTPEPNDPLSAVISEMAALLTQPKPPFGIMLLGRYGNGKTTMLWALRSLTAYLDQAGFLPPDTPRGLQIIDAREINQVARSYDRLKALRDTPMLGIDDFGYEATDVQDYGNLLAPVTDLMLYRYDRQLFTVVTSNLMPEELKRKYGDRLADRFREMFAKIIFGGETYRRNPE